MTDALRYLQKVSDGTYLGRGNFGSAYAVSIQGLTRIVKTPAQHDMHGRLWDPVQLRAEFQHEALVAQTLWNQGVRVVPDTAFAEWKGGYGIVREYGEIPANLQIHEVDALAEALWDVLMKGWKFSDDLLLARRIGGSLCIADVGFWHAWKADDDWSQRAAYEDWNIYVDRLIAQHWPLKDKPWAPAFRSAVQVRQRLVRAISYANEVADLYADDKPGRARWKQKESDRAYATVAAENHERAAFGLPPVT